MQLSVLLSLQGAYPQVKSQKEMTLLAKQTELVSLMLFIEWCVPNCQGASRHDYLPYSKPEGNQRQLRSGLITR